MHKVGCIHSTEAGGDAEDSRFIPGGDDSPGGPAVTSQSRHLGLGGARGSAGRGARISPEPVLAPKCLEKFLFQSVGLASLSLTQIAPPAHRCRLRHRHDSSQYAAVPLRQVFPIHSATFPRASRLSADVGDCSGDVSQSKLEKLFWDVIANESGSLSPAFGWMFHSR